MCKFIKLLHLRAFSESHCDYINKLKWASSFYIHIHSYWFDLQSLRILMWRRIFTLVMDALPYPQRQNVPDWTTATSIIHKKTSWVVSLPLREELWIVSFFTVRGQCIPLPACYTFLTGIIANTLRGTKKCMQSERLSEKQQCGCICHSHPTGGWARKGEAG